MMFARKFEEFAHGFARWAGSGTGFAVALATIVVWLTAGAFERFSNEWINAFCLYISCITYLMIFLMQRAQNKALSALQIQLSELIAVTHGADNKLINAERHSEKEIAAIKETHERTREAE